MDLLLSNTESFFLSICIVDFRESQASRSSLGRKVQTYDRDPGLKKITVPQSLGGGAGSAEVIGRSRMSQQHRAWGKRDWREAESWKELWIVISS